MGTVAVGVGVLVLLLTAASQSGWLGAHDVMLVAAVGVLGTVFCATVAFEAGSRRAAVAATVCLLPVALPVYFLMTSDG